MAENGVADQQQPPQVQMKILGQFIRDLSFENVMAQKGGTGEVQPNVSVQVNMDAKKRPTENQYEVMVSLKIDSKAKDSGDQLFLMEMEYAGIFLIEGVKDDQLHPFLLIECPRMLFPYLRRIVSDVTRDGGFPSLNLENIDFMQIYRDNVARLQAAQVAKKESESNGSDAADA
ncbi:MAG: protein-export chaperone SecB [Rhodobacteraceae bacterium]|nr:protein-export chaperone SecB [Paracoccaceae bacterium]